MKKVSRFNPAVWTGIFTVLLVMALAFIVLVTKTPYPVYIIGTLSIFVEVATTGICWTDNDTEYHGKGAATAITVIATLAVNSIYIITARSYGLGWIKTGACIVAFALNVILTTGLIDIVMDIMNEENLDGKN